MPVSSRIDLARLAYCSAFILGNLGIRLLLGGLGLGDKRLVLAFKVSNFLSLGLIFGLKLVETLNNSLEIGLGHVISRRGFNADGRANGKNRGKH